MPKPQLSPNKQKVDYVVHLLNKVDLRSKEDDGIGVEKRIKGHVFINDEKGLNQVKEGDQSDVACPFGDPGSFGVN
ncbi:unnamed protein product [Amaranthus hypochondriacus]